jgi:peptidase E
MINPKPVYLLAGGRGSENKAVFKEVFNEIARPNPLIAYVGVANNEDKTFFRFMGNEVKKAGKCDISHAIIASKKADLDKARDIMNKADAVFMSGGDVDAGMKVLESKYMLNIFTDLYNGGKVFFGASAGSIMLCREWVRWTDPDDDSTAEIFPCLDIAPVICDTHAEEDEWEELKTALQIKGDKATGYGIPSGACLKVHPDGRTEALGGIIAQYVKSGYEVIRSDDLLPG